jgi:hypothetical protein
MSVAGEATEDPGQSEGNEPAAPPELEGDIPKPAFELPDKEPEPEAPRQTAKDRSRERGQNFAEMRKELERERAERQRFGEKLAELQGRLDERTAATPTDDPLKAQLRANRKVIEQALERMGRGDSAAIDEWHEALENAQRLISRSEAKAAAADIVKSVPQPMDPVLAAVTSKYSWLQTDEDAKAQAEGVVRRLVRLEKRDMSDPAVRKRTLMQAAAETERDLELGDGGSTEPSDTQRERFRGVGGQTTGAGRSGKTVVSLTADQKAQAEMLFRDKEPEAAHREWWAKIGQRIANK